MNPPNGAVKAVGRGRGPWRADQNVIELRRPQNPSSPSGSDTSNSSNSAPGKDDIAIQSKLSVNAKEFVPLSVNAKEFVPRGFLSASHDNDPQSYDTSNDYYEADDQQDFPDGTTDEWIIHHLTEVIQNLTDFPGNFDKLVEPFLDELVPMVTAEHTIEGVVTVIVNQAIKERNFRYNGARLCNLLNCQLPGNNSAFRRILLTKLMEEHGMIESNFDKNIDQVYGFIQFMGELYTQLEISKGTNIRVSVLGESLLMALKMLIQVPLIDNIKNVCEVLKLSGRLLDIDHPDETSKFFNDLEKLLTDERAGLRGKAIINNVLKLRSENWGHSVSSENLNTPTSFSNVSNVTVWSNEGVHYGPDHQAITTEEYKFLDESCDKEETISVGDDSTVWDPDVNDDENAKIMAAFEEFVKHQPRQC